MLTPSYSLSATGQALPRLALDFTTATLDPRVSVTRALNTSTRVNSGGLIESVNADLPRFDYDPTTRVCRGLLIEEMRSNILLQSAGFDDIVWGKNFNGTGSAPVVTPNTGISPDGTSSADRAQLNLNGGTTTNDISTLYQIVTFPAGSSSFSVWLKSNTGVNQTVVLITWAGFLSVITVTPQWQRFGITVTTSATSSFVGIRARGGQSEDSIDVLIWGAQLEAGAFSTSYIPTTTATATRNADVVTITGTNFSDFWQASRGSALVRARPSIVSGIGPFIQFDDTTSNNIITLRGNTTNPELYIKSTTDQAQIDAGTIAAGTSYRLAGAWAENNCAANLNGGAPVLDTVATIPAVTQARFGSDGTNYLNGHLEGVEYYEDRVLNSTLQVISSTAGYQSIIGPVFRDVIIS